MKKPEEYLKEYMDKGVAGAIEQAQTDAWNEALDYAVSNVKMMVLKNRAGGFAHGVDLSSITKLKK